MTLTDQIIFASFLILSLGLGILLSGKQKNLSDYFLAGRSVSWMPMGISVMITAFSAINYTAFSGEVATQGFYVLLSVPVFFIVAWPVKKIILPFYHSLNIFSAYEYLEQRFDVKVRALASGMFIIWRMLWSATLIYVPAKILSAVTHYDFRLLVLSIGGVATIYTLFGGMKAVIKTDVLQYSVLIIGLIVSMFAARNIIDGGWGQIFSSNIASGTFRPFYPFDIRIFSLNPFIRITLWSCWAGTFVAFLTRYGADQVVVQRYFTTNDLKSLQRGFNWNILSITFALCLLALFGLILKTFIIQSGLPAGQKPVVYFSKLMTALPAGLGGLIVSGIFASSLSSADSGINSCCTALYSDFSNRFNLFPKTDSMKLIRLMTLVFGLIITLLALVIGRFGSIFEIANKVVNGFGAPLLAFFIAAKYFKNTGAASVFWGGLAGALFSAIVTLFVPNLALHFYAVVNLGGTLLIIIFINSFINSKLLSHD